MRKSKGYAKGGAKMMKAMRGRMMTKGMRKGGKMMSKGGAMGGKKRMNGKKNMGLYGRK